MSAAVPQDCADHSGQVQLLKRARGNEHVQVHELRGFISDDLHSGLPDAFEVFQALNKDVRQLTAQWLQKDLTSESITRELNRKAGAGHTHMGETRGGTNGVKMFQSRE
jgi:hypothetical protein